MPNQTSVSLFSQSSCCDNLILSGPPLTELADGGRRSEREGCFHGAYPCSSVGGLQAESRLRGIGVATHAQAFVGRADLSSHPEQPSESTVQRAIVAGNTDRCKL